MLKYLEVVQVLTSKFRSWIINKVQRMRIRSEQALKVCIRHYPRAGQKGRKIFIECLPEQSINKQHHEVKEVQLTQVEPCWVDPILAYLKQSTMPVDWKEVRRPMY